MKRGILILTAICGAVLLYKSFESGWLRFNYPSRERFPIQGIDVSHHQGEINWTLVREAGHDFAFIKATEGASFRDPLFTKNWKESAGQNISRGAYHFFTFCKSGIEQAENFMSVVPVEDSALPPVLDLEFGGNCGKRLTREELAREVGDFSRRVKVKYSKSPIFYVTAEFYTQYLQDHGALFPEHKLWLRDVFFEPKQKSCESWTFWQFANRGRVEGINGPVDLNVFCADRNSLKKLTAIESEKAEVSGKQPNH